MITFILSHLYLVVYLLALAGLYIVFVWAIDNLKSIVCIIQAVLRPYFQPEENLKLAERYGNWAVITGATDGIGKQYAKELASKGINVVLISRTASKLSAVANEIEAEYPVKTKWIAADFSEGQSIYKHIFDELQGIDVGILVNNVGRMYDYPDELANIPESLLWEIINVNISAVTIMTRMLVNDMKKRGKGAIVNISSSSSLQPLPYMAVYSASKVYVKNFTLALQHELDQYGIHVQLVLPMYVQTKMNEYSTTVMAGGILVPNVESYTRSAVFTLGKSSVTTGYWSHGIQYCAIGLVPEWFRTRVGAALNLKFRDEYFEKEKNATKPLETKNLLGKVN